MGFGILEYFTFTELFTIHLSIFTEVSARRSPLENVTFRIPNSRSKGSDFGGVTREKERANHKKQRNRIFEIFQYSKDQYQYLGGGGVGKSSMAAVAKEYFFTFKIASRG